MSEERKWTHMRYVCRVCRKGEDVKIDPSLAGEKQPWPSCCGKTMAFKGCIAEEK